MFWSDAKTQFCPKGLGAEKRQGRGSGELIHRGGKLEEGWGRSHLALGRQEAFKGHIKRMQLRPWKA